MTEATEKLLDAMRRIVRCESIYSTDPLTRANNAIEHIQAIATAAIKDAEESRDPSLDDLISMAAISVDLAEKRLEALQAERNRRKAATFAGAVVDAIR